MSKPSGSAWLALLSVFAVSGILLALHWLDPNYLPARHELAQYVLGAYGILMRLAFLLLSLAVVSLAYTLIVNRANASRLGVFLLILTAFGFLFAALFPPGPGGVANLLTEQVHSGSLGLARTSAMLGALAIAWRARHNTAGWLGMLLALTLAAAWLWFRNAPEGLSGWPDRAYFGSLAVYLFATALQSPKS